MKKLLLLILLTLSISVQAQYKIKTTTVNCDRISLKITDDTIYIPSGTRGSLILRNFENVVVIAKNATIKADANYGIWIANCKSLKLTGVEGYSLVVRGGVQGITASSLSTRIEICHADVGYTSFAGIMAKTDPTCDPRTWYENFIMEDVLIHNNYIHHTGAEGAYLGFTRPNGDTIKPCRLFVKAHRIKGLKFYNNRIDSTNADGMQVGSASGGADIYNNIISNTGLKPFEPYQNNGIQIGDGTAGAVYNNVIYNVPGTGIILLGTGNNTIHNNLITNVGIGIFTDERSQTRSGLNFTITNNTIQNCKNYGISVYSEQMNNYIINNVIFCNKPINKLNSSVKTIENNNVYKLDSLTFQGYKQ